MAGWEDAPSSGSGWEDSLGFPPSDRTGVVPKAPIPGKQTPDRRKGLDKTEIGTAGAVGMGAGLVAPELAVGAGRTMQGIGGILSMAPYLPAQRIGAALEFGGTGLTAAAPAIGRAMPALSGLIGGMLGETSGEVAEIKGASPFTSEATRLAAGLMPTSVVGGLVGATTKGPIGTAIKTAAKEFLSKKGIETAASAEEKKAIEGMIQNLMSFDPKSASTREMYKMLEDEAQRIQQRGTATAGRLEAGGQRAEQLAGQRAEQARARLQQVGNPDAEFDAMGRNLRGSMIRHQEEGIEARGTPYGEARNEVLRIATEKQNRGDLVEGTRAYQELLADLRRKARVGREGEEVALAEVTEPGVEGAYRQILNAIERKQGFLGTSADPTVKQRAEELKGMGLKVREAAGPEGSVNYYREYPTAYEALDDVRRRLGTQAKFGEPTTGYEALKSNQASDLYGSIRKIQSEYIGDPFNRMQSIYEQGSAVLQPFEGKAGKAAVGVDLRDPERYKKAPVNLANDIFGSRQGVDDFLRLSGNDTATLQREASNYVARNLNGKSVTQAETWLNSQKQEFLRHPALQDVYTKASDYFQNLRIADELAGRGTRFAATAKTEADAARKDATEAAQGLVGKLEAIPRIEQILLSKEKGVWDAAGPVLMSTNQGKDHLANAIMRVMGKQAAKNRQAPAEVFRDSISDSLTRTGMDQLTVDAIQTQLDRVATFALPEPAMLSLIEDIIQKGIRQYALPRAATAIEERVK
jgi:hypothetical protein